MRRPATVRADLRLRALDRVLRRIGPPIGQMTTAQLEHLRARRIPRGLLADRVFGVPASDVDVVDQRIDEGDWPLPLRIYRPPGADDRPLIVFLHGGGWVIGNVHQGEWLCSRVAATVGAVVVAMGYRLAPQHRFPIAVEDAYRGVRWIASHATALGGDPARVGVMGASAGGNLAAVVCQLARDAGGPAIAHQTLLYAPTDVTSEAAPSPELDDAPLLPLADRVVFLDHYLGDGDPFDPRASPMRADSLAGLPPALVITAEHDPLRDDGRHYAQRLAAEGTPARYTDYVGMAHGFLSFPGLASGARQALAEICQELAAAL